MEQTLTEHKYDLYMEQNPAWLQLAFIAIHRPEPTVSLLALGDGADFLVALDRLTRALYYVTGLARLEMPRLHGRDTSTVLTAYRTLDRQASIIHLAHYTNRDLIGRSWTGMVLYDNHPMSRKRLGPDINTPGMEYVLSLTAGIRKGCVVGRV